MFTSALELFGFLRNLDHFLFLEAIISFQCLPFVLNQWITFFICLHNLLNLLMLSLNKFSYWSQRGCSLYIIKFLFIFLKPTLLFLFHWYILSRCGDDFSCFHQNIFSTFWELCDWIWLISIFRMMSSNATFTFGCLSNIHNRLHFIIIFLNFVIHPPLVFPLRSSQTNRSLLGAHVLEWVNQDANL